MKKQANCPNCHEKTYHVSTIEDGQPAWQCNLCLHVTPRRVQSRPTESSPLTPAQIREITRIQQYKLRDWGVDYEVKKFIVKQLGFAVSVVCEVGRKGDEGTMAALLCRYYGHFFVRRGGAIEALEAKEENKAKAKKYPLIYGWRS